MTTPSSSNREDVLQRNYVEIAQLAGGLAHEIRNPLSTICLNLEILKEELRESEDPRDRQMKLRLDSIRKECTHLEELLNEFLQFARGLELTREPCDLSQMVREFLEFQRPSLETQNIDVNTDLASDLPQVNLDMKQMRSVLLNLTLNAVQAMPQGGTLEYRTSAENSQIVFELTDSGDGVPDWAQEKIFNLFFSTKPNGSGLGLPTVRKIVEAHGGTIEFHSEAPKGTSFRITLPALPDTKSPV